MIRMAPLVAPDAFCLSHERPTPPPNGLDDATGGGGRIKKKKKQK